MGSIGDSISSIFGGGDDDSSDAIEQAAETEASYQLEALDYLKETEEIPQQYREGALGQLAGIYGLEGGTTTETDFINSIQNSALYQSLLSGREAGEESILANAAATGGLRSGNVQEALYDYNVQLENQALLQAYSNQIAGLGGLAELPSLAPAIASQTSSIGSTLAAGQIAAAQASADTSATNFSNLLGLTSVGLTAYDMFSDRRLKKNITKVGKVNGWNWYTWDWNSVAQKMGLLGSSQGVIADEVFEVMPEAIHIRNLFMTVDYRAIGVL